MKIRLNGKDFTNAVKTLSALTNRLASAFVYAQREDAVQIISIWGGAIATAEIKSDVLECCCRSTPMTALKTVNFDGDVMISDHPDGGAIAVADDGEVVIPAHQEDVGNTAAIVPSLDGTPRRTISSEEAKALAFVTPALSSDFTREEFTTAFFDDAGHIVATDGHRMIEIRLPKGSSLAGLGLLPGSLCRRIVKLDTAELVGPKRAKTAGDKKRDTYRLEWDKDGIKYTFMASAPVERYPDFLRILPSSTSNWKSTIIDARNTCKVLKPFAKNTQQVPMRMRPSVLGIDALMRIPGKGKDAPDMLKKAMFASDGDELPEITVDVRYLYDALAGFSGEVIIAALDADSPVFISEGNAFNTDRLAIVMPMEWV